MYEYIRLFVYKIYLRVSYHVIDRGIHGDLMVEKQEGQLFQHIAWIKTFKIETISSIN